MSERIPITTKPLSWWAQHFVAQHCTKRKARHHIKKLIRNNIAVVMVNGSAIDYEPQAYLFCEDSILDDEGDWLTGVYLAIDMNRTILF